jgi:zinc D-Ala-D-Ala carboxypeptidase
MQISMHFTLEELCFSATAARLGLDNAPTPSIVANLKQLAAVMEDVRLVLGGLPIVVHSGYRSVATNYAVGGVRTSAHCLGLACDFVCPSFGRPADIALTLMKSDIAYDQLILEYGWVHIGLPQVGLTARRQTLTKRAARAAYESGIHA